MNKKKGFHLPFSGQAYKDLLLTLIKSEVHIKGRLLLDSKTGVIARYNSLWGYNFKVTWTIHHLSWT